MTPQSSTSPRPIAVVGEGWSALATVGFLVSSGVEVKWVVGSGAHMVQPLASIEWGPGVHVWNELAQRLGVGCGEFETGVWIREFRNKAFRAPNWSKAPTPESKADAKNELLWAPEQRLVGVFEARWENMTVAEIEEEFRKILLSGRFPNLQRIEGVPVVGFEKSNSDSILLKLASGDQFECTQIVYADRWSILPTLEGLPKGLPFTRKRDPMGFLQASFVHDFPQGSVAARSSYFAPLFRAPGKEIERHVWGHFSSDGKRSSWTLCLAPEDLEDNHEIGKKLRRLKGTLDRIFQDSDIVPAGKENFAATILEEQVRFEEDLLFTDGDPVEAPIALPSLPGVEFLTDGYGPTRAFQQVGAMLGISLSTEPKSLATEIAESSDAAASFVENRQ